MYRQYEDPYKLERELEQLEQAYAQCENDDERVDLYLAISELKDRINFAWQDDEYDCDYMCENYPEDYLE